MPPKRKSTTETATAATRKKAKLDDTVQRLADGAQVVADILDNDSYEGSFDFAEFTRLANYARLLENEVANLKPKAKSSGEIAAEVEKLAAAVHSGIKKQLGWKPSCKTGAAKWVYDGVCNDPEVFGRMLGLGGPPTFKAKKLTPDEFASTSIGAVHGSVRYNTLRLHGNINIRWPGDGTFKMSGCYGL